MRTGEDGSEQASLYFGRYVDAFECRAGTWRVAARTYLLHHAGQLPSSAALPLGGRALADGLEPAHRLSLDRRASRPIHD